MDKIKTYEVEWVETKKIQLDESNPNEMSEIKLNALRTMMKEKGMLQPILIDQNGVMTDGEHRFKVFVEFGMKKIPCYRLELTDGERRLLRQTMNKIKGEHNPREDIEDLLRLSKEMQMKDLSEALGQEEDQLRDYLDSINQVPENFLSMIIDEKKNTKRVKFINFKLTDDQAKKLIDEIGEDKLKDIVLLPEHGMLVDLIGK